MKAKLIKTDLNYILEDDKGVVIASTSLKKEGLLLSPKNCREIERGYDLDELVKRKYLDGYDTTELCRLLFKGGFQEALELMGDKKFSEQDMYKMFIYGRSIDTAKKHLKEIEDKPIDEFFNDFIQSLQQKEWDVEIEMQKVKDETKIVGAVKGVKGSGSKITTYKSVPKLDADGCLILKLKSE